MSIIIPAASAPSPPPKASRLQDIATARRDLYMIDPRLMVRDDDWNAREEGPALDAHIRWLADSIKEEGVKEPLVVLWRDQQVVVRSGHCRHRATMLAISEGADIAAVPCRPEERGTTEADRILELKTRNGGLSLTPLETAIHVYARLIKLGWEPAKIAKKDGVSNAHVSNMLLLAEAPATIHQMVRAGQISATLAVETIRSRGEKAFEVLTEAYKAAVAAGKTKATDKHIEKAPPPAAPKAPPALPENTEVVWQNRDAQGVTKTTQGTTTLRTEPVAPVVAVAPAAEAPATDATLDLVSTIELLADRLRAASKGKFMPDIPDVLKQADALVAQYNPAPARAESKAA
jgi:ParB-like chromosome segregation protein Spo0J